MFPAEGFSTNTAYNDKEIIVYFSKTTTVDFTNMVLQLYIYRYISSLQMIKLKEEPFLSDPGHPGYQ